MSVESLQPPRARVRELIQAVPTTVWIGALVVVGTAVRLVASSHHTVARLFPDEYIYASLGRSLGEGSLTIRGTPAAFPALLEPLLAAPLWRLADDAEAGYRLVQALHSVAAALVVVPVFLIARLVGLDRSWALAASALALLLPAGVYAGYITADAVAWPLSLAAIAAGTAALTRPTRHTQVLFVGFAAAATLARVQYVVLPVAFFVAAVIVERGRLRHVAREFRLSIALLALPLLAVAAAGPGRLLGYYSGVLQLDVDAGAIGRWLLLDSMLLVYAAGVVLIPCAVVGLALSLVRPGHRSHQAFAALTTAFAAALLCEAALYASNGSERFQERYLIALLPLVPIAFLLGVGRLRRRGTQVAAAALAAALFLVVSIVPLSEYTVLEAKLDSPTLQAAHKLLELVGTGTGSLLIAAGASTLLLVAAVGIWRPRLAPALGFAAAAAALGAATVAGAAYDADLNDRVYRTYGDRPLSWIDKSQVGRVAVLQTPYSSRVHISSKLFWNASLVEILRMDGASEVDAYGSRRVRVEPRGTIRADGELVRGPLLVDEYASWAQLEEARLVRRTINAALWAPEGTPRLSVLLAGRYFDGMLNATSSLTVWPGRTGHRTGVLELPLSLPAEAPAAQIAVTGPGVDRVITVPSGGTTVLRVPFDITDAWTIELWARRPLSAPGGRVIAAFAGLPRLIDAATQTGEKA